MRRYGRQKTKGHAVCEDPECCGLEPSLLPRSEMNKRAIQEGLDDAFEAARKILDDMPAWQREYADEVINSALEPEDSDSMPKMFG
jgi:hypothetical protein